MNPKIAEVVAGEIETARTYLMVNGTPVNQFQLQQWAYKLQAIAAVGDSRVVPAYPTDEMIVAVLELQGEDALAAKAPALISALVKIYVAMVNAAPLQAAPNAVVVDEAMFQRASQAYSDTYDAEYKLHGPVDNHSTALRTALTAALTSGDKQYSRDILAHPETDNG